MRITRPLLIFVFLLALLALVNVWLLTPNTSKILDAAESAKEQQRPAQLSAVFIEPENCATCLPLTPVLDQVKQSNVSLSDVRSLRPDSEEAQALIEKHTLTTLPALLVMGELEKNVDLQTFWDQNGSIQDGTFVFLGQRPPYEEIETGNVRGVFTAKYVTDSQCEDCYDVMWHAGVLTNLGLAPAEDGIVDIRSTEGQALRRQYDIRAVPTVILFGDLAAYNGFAELWGSVGSIESDGAYVFREKGIIAAQTGIYNDLWTGTKKDSRPVQK